MSFSVSSEGCTCLAKEAKYVVQRGMLQLMLLVTHENQSVHHFKDILNMSK